MSTAAKQKVVLLVLLAIALALLGTIAFIVIDRIEAAKWTYIALEDDAIAEMEEDASMYGMTNLRDPKLVATEFFENEGYGEPAETKILHSGKTITYLMKNKDGLKVKMYLIQPGTKGSTGVWFVKRYIADPLPDDTQSSSSSGSSTQEG